ncbi:MAG TPA: HlyD family secretion protein [Chthoniobacterales bacterium]|jgi:membrane fusion protein (multidrug efflux system)|nr:HlyD family secretion protein [Chthoniobacterales bacterium]
MNPSTNEATVQDPSQVRALAEEPITKESTTKPQAKGKKSLVRWLALPVVILVVVTGVWYWLYSSQFEETDDAYVTGNEHPVSFRVAGTISKILVDDNQFVKQGQPIAKLDPRDYQVALTQAKASFEQAKAQLAQSQAQLIQADAELKYTRAQAEASKAKQDDSQRLFERSHQLFSQGKGYISKQDLDDTQFKFEGNKATYNRDVAAVNVAEAHIQTAKAEEEAAAAQVEVASAKVQNAELQLSYTTVYAPADGHVAEKTFETGQTVEAGQQGLSISQPDVWVVANFKETQLGRIRPGQPVEIGVDALPNHKFTGTVNSFQAGTGAVFALLPSDNATGNFTKIVQRVPVKITFDPGSIQGYEQLIVPGLSVEPKIRVKPKA